jgi:hypothetical protein
MQLQGTRGGQWCLFCCKRVCHTSCVEGLLLGLSSVSGAATTEGVKDGPADANESLGTDLILCTFAATLSRAMLPILYATMPLNPLPTLFIEQDATNSLHFPDIINTCTACCATPFKLATRTSVNVEHSVATSLAPKVCTGRRTIYRETESGAL